LTLRSGRSAELLGQRDDDARESSKPREGWSPVSTDKLSLNPAAAIGQAEVSKNH
jgi:hypothetical protein